MTVNAGIVGAQSVNRAIEVLRSVASLQRAGATLAAVVRMTGLNRTTAFRLLQCLVEERMLSYDEIRRIYSIGSLTVELGLVGGSLDHIAGQWRSAIQSIAERTGMTAYLVARSGTEVVCVCSCEAPAALRAVPLVPGQRLPLGVGAGSLAILTSLKDDEVDAVLNANERQRSAQSARTVSREELLHRIGEVRAKGFACSSQTVAEGIVGLGIVVPQANTGVQLAASVSKVGTSMDDAEQIRLADIIRQELESHRPN